MEGVQAGEASSGSAPGPSGPQSVCDYWKEFELDSFRARLSEDALKLSEVHDDFLASRKELAASTKAMRRSLPADTLSAVQPLLKAYQGEVDRLTQRAKSGEALFLDVYQRLYAAPDPASYLVAGLEAS
ncbi:hypothetical protein H632_c1822p1, partial [Helicosporidium sp. ATCC 50920]